jgi:hypothetical protein
MAETRKPRKPRKPLGFFDAQAKVMHLGNVYRADRLGVGVDGPAVAKQTHGELDDVPTAEPFEDLAESELSDSERNAAIGRERLRREGRDI